MYVIMPLQMLQHLAEVNHLLVYREIQHCLCAIVGKDQVCVCVLKIIHV
jgi:hypothetical protein